MKKLFYTFVLSSLLITHTNIANSKSVDNVNIENKIENKIAIVDISSIFQELLKNTDTIKKLENNLKNRAIDLQNQENDLQKKIQNFQRDSSTMKLSERTKIEKDLIKQRENFSSQAQIFEQDNRRLHIAEHNKILKRIRLVVKKIANSQGYNIVIDTNAIAYFSKIKDITKDVLKQVQ